MNKVISRFVIVLGVFVLLLVGIFLVLGVIMIIILFCVVGGVILVVFLLIVMFGFFIMSMDGFIEENNFIVGVFIVISMGFIIVL